MVILFLTLAVADVSTADADQRPNVLLIMADDLGFSDLGFYGGEIETPNLDSLAKHGLRFTQFHNTARCWPTRAALLTGYYAQQVRRDVVPKLKSGGRGKRPAWAPLVSATLRKAGLTTYHSGKWHLDGMPLQTGFDRSYYLRDQGRFFSPKVHYLDDKKLPAVERGTGFYGTDAITDHAVKCLEDHSKNHAGQPFFHYLAYTAPHFPLHALPEDIAKYKERYQVGWDKIRQQRWERIKKLGLVKDASLSKVERDIGPPYHFPDHLKILGSGEVNRPVAWHELTDEQKQFQANKMAIHAAMVDRMDQGIGRVLAQLKRMNAFENTIIMFLSDNGASAEIMVRNDGHDPQAAPGSAESYLCLGPGWSTACNTPFRRHKTWVHEGSCATPFIVHWASAISSGGQLRHTPGHVVDVVPTILDVLGVKADETTPGKPGSSIAKIFSQDTSDLPHPLWWLHEGNRAIRVGDWKLVSAKNDAWELFNIEKDRTETENLAAKHPEKLKHLEQAWTRQWESIQKLAATDD